MGALTRKSKAVRLWAKAEGTAAMAPEIRSRLFTAIFLSFESPVNS